MEDGGCLATEAPDTILLQCRYYGSKMFRCCLEEPQQCFLLCRCSGHGAVVVCVRGKGARKLELV